MLEESAQTMPAAKLRAKCLELTDEATETGTEIVITKRGTPMTRLVPSRHNPRSLFGVDRERIEILGDITAPIDAESNSDRVLTP